MDEPWNLALFRKSILKQEKYRALLEAIGGPTEGLDCLDVGGDNGVISYLLRQRGGRWTSADMDDAAVASIRELVGDPVVRLEGEKVPFADGQFDQVVIIDYLEHVARDDLFAAELHRILRPGGRLIVNTPHAKRSPLRSLRLALGQTDERHGHLRHGYTDASIRALLGPWFEVDRVWTYSKFFSELIDTAMQAAVERVKGEAGSGGKGVLVTGGDVRRHEKALRQYSRVYPVLKGVASLNALCLPFSGYKLIATARRREGPTEPRPAP
jgi:ubiquinone/menaquinone biosynthesis C-methylase UbiE